MNRGVRIAGLFLIGTSLMIGKAKEAKTVLIAHFQPGRPGSDISWSEVNDVVMGGLSQGGASREPGRLVFSGTVSLENNGGFSSIRTEKRDFAMDDFDGVVLRVKGDGNTYQFRMHTNARYQGEPVGYVGDFTTVEGEWIEVEIPFTALRQSFRGRTLTDYPFDPTKVERLGFLIAEKQAGDFRLEVEWIAGYSEG